MSCKYRLLQLTNNSIGAVAAAAVLPLGVVSRKVANESKCVNTFEVTTTSNNVIYINEPGYYKILYTGSLDVVAAGSIVVNLEVNNVVVSTATVTATAAGTVPVTISFVIRVLGNCCNTVNLPQVLQFRNNGIALTGGNSNIVIEKIY